VGFGLWCLCIFFVCCDKRGRRSISKQYTYNKEQREVEKVGGENREENMRSCDSLGFSLSGISRSGFSVLLASFSLHWGTLIPFPAAPISHTLRTLFPTQPQKPLLMLCVSLPHAADVFQNGTRHVASGPKSHLCPAPFLQRLTISQLIANFFGKYHSSYLFGENRFNHSEIKVFQGSASLYH